jgi:[ribosomal protein S5]-alanine N-acetyltransferase
MHAHISTDRLILDLITESDAEFMLTLLNTEGWLRFVGDRKVRTLADSIAYIRKLRARENLFYWVVRRKESADPLGIISFIKRDYLENFDIGFAFLPEYVGKGYAKEAAKSVLAIAGQDPAIETVLATTLPENERSIGLLEKLGFRFSHTIHEGDTLLHVYSNPPG